MNLHALAGPVIAAVNPMIPALVQISLGSTIGPGGVQSARYQQPPLNVWAQVQPQTFRDIMQMDKLNLQGTRKVMYLFGEVDGIVRSENKGGDLITIESGPHAGIYLVALVLEQWPDWVKVAVTLQNNQ